MAAISKKVKKIILRYHPHINIDEVKTNDKLHRWSKAKEGYYIINCNFSYYKNDKKEGISFDTEYNGFWNYHKDKHHGRAYTNVNKGLILYGFLWRDAVYGQHIEIKKHKLPL